MSRFVLLGFVFGCLLPLTASTGVAAVGSDDVRFNQDIRPLLSDRCFHCHGPDAEERQAGLRLDQADGAEGAHAFAIEPGDAEASELWYRITSDDPALVMPPPESHKQPLSEQEKELFRRWIEQGAGYESFWAFTRPELPKLSLEIEGAPIDRFVQQRLQKEGMQPASVADKRTLIRRVTFDLTGLPPTREEIAEFLEDEDPNAYERLVDRLLASPHYGEHMARYWLDLVRFADTNGIHHDHYRDLSPYRDWVIRAFNENLPYDDFTRYQIAGDLYPDPTRDQLIASGFHRLHLIIDVGTALPEESFTRNVLDRVTSVGTAFMGLTVQCAVCHDHKYDPISQKDFYSLAAFFNNIDARPETGGRRGTDFRRGLQPPYINLTTPEQEQELEQLKSAVRVAQEKVHRLRQELSTLDEKAAREATEKEVQQAEQVVREAQQARDKFLLTLPAAMVMKERSDVRPSHVLIRGQYDNPGEVVPRSTPGFLPPLHRDGSVATRMELADWLVSRDHPLTARVAVNRFWQQLFGVGIVRTAEDFGAQGEWPSHPDLLDYLAVRFIESGWNVRAIMKEIAMSETYRQSSIASPEAYRADPENRLLARGPRHRLDAEVIRDQVLASSGMLNRKMFGKSVKPPQPEGLWAAVSMPSSYPSKFSADEGDKVYRRSVYTFWKRGMPPPQMTILNAPTREECIARRERTNTPLQALLLLNESEYLNAAGHLAGRVLAEIPRQTEHATDQRLDVLYETITSQLPDEATRQAFTQLVSDLQSLYASRPELAAQLCQEHSLADGISPAEFAAWTVVTSSIYNLDITKTKQ